MHRRIRLLVAFVLALVAIALPFAPAQAVCVDWGIELSPKYGPPGTVVTVSGHDFAEHYLVDIYYGGYGGNLIASDYTDNQGNFIITFTIPEGCAGEYQVLARVNHDVHTYFTVKPGLTITPQKGPVGTNVTVTGQGFAKNEDGIELRYFLTADTYEVVQRRLKADANGSWETSFQIPDSARGEHKIDAEGAISRHFDVKDAIFRVTAELSLDKSAGIAGESVTVMGSRFAAYEKNIQVLFNGQTIVKGIRADSKGEWQATFGVPEMAGGNYTVTARGDLTWAEDIVSLRFEIRPQLTLSPTEGYVGTEVTLVGQGFAASRDIVINYDGKQATTARTDDKGHFETSFSVPPSHHGEHSVTVGYSADNVASAIFIMESDPPPTPQLLSPARGSRLGFWGNVTPKLEWSQVSDPSGVRYSLQLASSADFSTGSLIASVEDLADTSYTPAEALPMGSYYWRVKAIDGAENDSGWSAAYSFGVGLMPRWAFIVVGIVILVFFIALIRAAIIRRRYYY